MNESTTTCVRLRPDGCELLVHVVPNAGRTQSAGLHGDALRVRVAAPALDGRANAALVAWLADQLALPRSAIMLAGGERSRRKRLYLACPVGTVVSWLASLPG